jgi:hypothetical protein
MDPEDKREQEYIEFQENHDDDRIECDVDGCTCHPVDSDDDEDEE